MLEDNESGIRLDKIGQDALEAYRIAPRQNSTCEGCNLGCYQIVNINRICILLADKNKIEAVCASCLCTLFEDIACCTCRIPFPPPSHSCSKMLQCAIFFGCEVVWNTFCCEDVYGDVVE